MRRRRERRADRHRREHLRDVGAGVDGFDAIHLLGGAGIDRGDLAVRDVAALEREVQHAGHLEIIDVGAEALDQARVLAALDALADQFRKNRCGGGHGYLACLSAAVFRGVLNGVDDVLIAGAAAEVAGDAVANLLLARRRIVLQQVDRRHDHARRAVAALQAVLFPEALLHRMQLAFRRQPFDRHHRRAVGLHREDRARLRAAAVDEHGARAALAGVAADMRAGEIEMFAQEVHEQRARFDVRFAHLAVDGNGDWDHRGADPSPNGRVLATGDSGYWLLSAAGRGDVDALHDQGAVLAISSSQRDFLLFSQKCWPPRRPGRKPAWRACDKSAASRTRSSGCGWARCRARRR